MSIQPGAVSSPAVLATVRRLAADALAAEVIDAFRAEDIRSLLLKGPATTRWLYDEGTARLYRDVDVLVAPADFDRAEALLARLGLSYHLDAVAPDEQVAHARRWMRQGHVVSLDLHRTLPGVGVDARRTWDVLSERTERCDVGGVDAETLAEPGRALLLALHAASHGIRASQPLADLQRGLARLDVSVWDEAATLAKRLGCHAAFAAGLLLLPQGAEVAARTGMPDRLPPDVVLRASSPPDTAFGFERLAAARGARAKARLLGREVVPTSSFMRAWSPMAARSGAGLALAYLWRPLWLLLHARAGLNAWRRAQRDAR
ncbi:MAG: hypothetical protein QOI98_2049 [Solirubrobacteraceae bacterium]|jgi:hypothetical protein|nr:hypothetical protein [Solirubrobacteraceae bacterium]